MCSAVVRRGDSAETLLSCGIPNLEFDRLSLELNSANLEIDTDGRDVTFCVGIVRKAEEEARLSNARVTNEKEFEKVVVLLSSRERRSNSRFGIPQDRSVSALSPRLTTAEHLA